MSVRVYAAIIVILILSAALVADAQTEAPYPRTSIFVADVCTPPCWFGLIPGQSTSNDVEIMFNRYWESMDPVVRGRPNRATYDPNTGLIISGPYVFSWRQYTRVDYPRQFGSSIKMRNGVVFEMQISANADISLRDVLEAYGPPNLVYLNFLQFQFQFRLIYLADAFYVVVEDLDSCSVKDALDDFEFLYISIFSAAEALRPYRFSNRQEEQPQLIAMQDGGVNVPLDTWESWLNGESDMTCGQASWSVAEGIVTPDLNALEATATAQAPLFTPTATSQP